MKNVRSDFLPTIMNHIHLEIMDHGHILADSDWRYDQISSPFNRLYLVKAGEGTIKNDQHTIVLQPGTAYLIPVHSTYSYSCEQFMEKFYIHFRMELFSGQDLFDEMETCLFRPLDVSLIEKVIDMAQSMRLNELMKCQSLLLGVIADFVDENMAHLNEQMALGAKYQGIYYFVKNNCYADMSPHQIADQVGLSLSALSKNFRKDTGETLKSYLDKKIIERVKERLLLTDMNISEIADEMHFRDSFYFSRFFKKHVGMPPTEYRKKNIMK